MTCVSHFLLLFVLSHLLFITTIQLTGVATTSYLRLFFLQNNVKAQLCRLYFSYDSTQFRGQTIYSLRFLVSFVLLIFNLFCVDNIIHIIPPVIQTHSFFSAMTNNYTTKRLVNLTNYWFVENNK